MSVYERTIVGKNGKRAVYLYVEVPLPNGKKLKRSVGKKGIITKAMARQVEQELKRKIKLGQWDMIQADIPALNEFIPKFILYLRDIKQNRAWRQAENCVKDFARVFGAKKLSEINSADVEDYKCLRTQIGKKPATINKALSFVRHLFNYAKRCNKFFANNPISISGLLPVNNQKSGVLSLEEENLLLGNAEEPLKSMIKIALLTGLRLNSIRTLAWKYIDFGSNAITVDAVYSKNKKTHIIPMSANLIQLLREAKLRCGGSQYVFPQAMEVTSSTISIRFSTLCKKLGVKDLRFHDLRHTCGTRLAEKGHGIETISKALGHSSITMSMRYVHPKDSVKRAMEDLATFENLATNIATNEEFDGLLQGK